MKLNWENRKRSSYETTWMVEYDLAGLALGWQEVIEHDWFSADKG
jgi:hypothetical protein